MNPYKKLGKKKLLEFHKDCLRAAYFCPQFRGACFEHEDILLGDEKKSSVVKFWSEETVLWNAGYSVELSEESVAIILAFRVKQAKKQMKKLGRDDEDE